MVLILFMIFGNVLFIKISLKYFFKNKSRSLSQGTLKIDKDDIIFLVPR